jgi:hypothetical protein
LTESEISPILLLCPFEPTEEEYNIVAQFSKVQILVGDPRSHKDIVSAGLKQAERVVLINISNTLSSSRDDFGDSSTIMISHLIYNTFLVCFRVSNIKEIGRRMPMVIDLEKRANIKFLRPSARDGKRGKKQGLCDDEEDWKYHPVLASGQVLASGMLDPILFQSYKNDVILPVIKLLCGLKFEEDYRMDHEVGVKPGRFAHVPVPDDFINRPYVDVYEYFASHGVIPMGIYRVANNDGYIYIMIYD